MSDRRVALVTGGTRGIGLGIARALAGENCDLVLCGRRRSSEARGVVRDLRALGGQVIYARADVGRRGDRVALLRTIRERFDRLDVLVSNAGVAPLVRADILEASEESFERLVRVNLQGAYFLAQAAARWMVEQARSRPFNGCMVFISSVSATLASTNRGDYCITKAGLSMVARLWAVRLSEFGIPVYDVRPGIVATDMTAGVREKYDRLIAEGHLLQPRWGTPEDVGRAVAVLVRGDLGYSSGSVIMVDGGQMVPRL
jgi:NAD(P)-dependent dehydrogenase (short-subunit alcohol dehydrogenase family)